MSPKVEPSPFDGNYLCSEFLQTCAANLTRETLVSRLSFMADASEVTWYAHQIDSDACHIFHNATCTRMP